VTGSLRDSSPPVDGLRRYGIFVEEAHQEAEA
jgi:hypothetical protein